MKNHFEVKITIFKRKAETHCMLPLEYNTIVVKSSCECFTDTEITDEICSKFQNETIRSHPFYRTAIEIRRIAEFSYFNSVA